MLPKSGHTYTQERRGIAAVQSFAAGTGQIWRETNTGDVGIDGHLEFVNAEGFATGKTVALQVKSGPSFFTHQVPTGWKFYPEPKHRSYWEGYPLPVILVLHNPDMAASYWVDVRQCLRSPASSEDAYVLVPHQNMLDEHAVPQIFETAGAQVDPFIYDLDDVVREMVARRSQNGSFPISYFDLFTQGLTNLARSVYFHMDLASNAAEWYLAESGSEFGVGVGEGEHEFLFGYVRFLLAQNLANVDFADCLIDWIDRKMQPRFVAPLTARGRRLVKAIHAMEAEMIKAGQLPNEEYLHVAQEGFFAMIPASYFRRLPRIQRFQEVIESNLLAKK
ncbi:DUF4365 domain-containing protein [Bradyrhizobium sp. AZCC 2289]|uniref:DUF4365 domain-containing protein n=1 Tax=Bradyrhizobium sp. AZCC 2289 TaxID=3117026 RepID=UPI002FF167F1